MVKIPPIIYGTAWKRAQTESLVAAAIRLGFRAIDTACQPKHYDEAAVGAAVATCLNATLGRSDLYLQTKFTPVSGQDIRAIPYDPTAPLTQQVAQSCAASLHNLQTNYLDCLVLHSPLQSNRETGAVWGAMESLVADDRCRSLGLSNCYRLDELERLHDLARIKPSVLQNRFYADSGYDHEIRAFCRHQGIVYQSFWTLTANPHVLAHATLTGLVSRYGRTVPQIFFRYLTQRDVVPLSGTCSEAHMREDLSIFEFELAPGELEAIDTVLRA